MSTLNISDTQKEKLQEKWSKLAKTPISSIVILDNEIIAFSTELGCYRLGYIFRKKDIRVDFSPGVGEWYFIFKDPESTLFD